MNDEHEIEEQSSRGGFSLDSIYYVLFRRKWIILFFLALAMVLGVVVLFVVKPPQYHSEAKLHIKYVTDTRIPTAQGAEAFTQMLNTEQDSIINTEIDIIRSMDLAQSVVRSLGAERILAKAGGGSSFDAAVALVRGNLTVESLPRRSTLLLLFRHPDPTMAQDILKRIVKAYTDRHIEMNHPAQVVNYFTNQTLRLREELSRTEQHLKEARANAGVFSIADSRKAFADEMAGIREELMKAQAELAGYQAIVTQPSVLNATNTAEAPPTNFIAQPSADVRNDYKRICDHLDQLFKKRDELRLQFTTNNIYVQSVLAMIENEHQLKQKLEAEYPSLISLGMSSPQAAGQVAVPNDPGVAAVQIRALTSKIAKLETQLDTIKKDIAKVDEWEGEITRLQREQEDLEAQLKRVSAGMNDARVNAVGSGNALNIVPIDSPTSPRKMWSNNFLKKLGMLVGGCAAFGFLLAFALEFVLDRSVKRPSDIESKLRLPLMISIPDLTRNGHGKSGKGSKKPLPRVDVVDDPGKPAGDKKSVNGTMAVALWDREDHLRRFCEGLRDRVIIDFDIRNVPHKPKLVAVTSCHRGAGVTSIASGLTAALSESGSGNAMLVDMNDDKGRATRFRRGKMSAGPEERWERETNTEAAPEPEPTDRLPSNLPRAFANLLPNLKAGDFDYIVFDMPPVTQTSMTARLAGIMDCVLLIIESEKTNQEAVQQANSVLTKSKANVTTVLNKVRTYIPTRLYQDFLSDT